MFKNIVIAMLSAGWVMSLPFFYGKGELFIVVATVVLIVCVEIEDLTNDIKAHLRWKKKLAAELEAAGREARKKIG